MTSHAAEMTDHDVQMTTLQRLATYLAWFVAGAIFWVVGWPAMAPADPLGAVTVVSHGNAALMLLAGAVLACIVAGVATVLAGKILLDAGTFAAMLGLVILSFRGSTANTTYLSYVSVADNSANGLAWLFAVESVGWIAVSLLALFASAMTTRRLVASEAGAAGASLARSSTDSSGKCAPSAITALAGCNVPLIGEWLFGRARRTPQDVRTDASHMLVVSAIAVVLVAVLSQGLDARATTHGQSCFVVAVSVAIGCHFAYRVAPTSSPIWSIFGVWVAVLAAYIWASTQSGGALPPAIAPSVFLRILPIQFVCVGTAAAVFMSWYQPHLFTSEHDTHRGGRRSGPAHSRREKREGLCSGGR